MWVKKCWSKCVQVFGSKINPIALIAGRAKVFVWVIPAAIMRDFHKKSSKIGENVIVS